MISLLTLSRWFMDRASIFAGIAACGVVALGLMPDAGPSAETDEYVHAGAFLVIAFLFCAATPRRPWMGAVAAFALGALIEIAQMFVPDRWAGLEDIAANLFGVVLGVGLFILFTKLVDLGKSPHDQPT